ncbi:ArsR/SmtB family transcription factor [Halobaculum rubrum]|uniref:ArsR/SmtB family transcription factor n=1 Tax=Halobaculum rubrum TaxID=2872158 RepID=UPI001CA41FD0|nr:ArsR family transcriptional regulator [Halobaculum rubrum]QZY00003.1 ArsR family transcriptional regulator [Halobaculum rubrum]
MDSAVLLDLLGNENRRRILRLLSHKPCYVTEISEYLGVSPKAVIDHLRKLEDAGLIESHTDDRRRKYFHIARDVRLEVNVSRHGFGTKSAYPANPSLDIQGSCPHMHIDLELRSADGDRDGGGADGADAGVNGDAAADGVDDDRGDLAQLAAEFDELQDLENELSLAQRWVHGRMSDLLDRVNDRLGVDADSRFYAKLLAAVTSTDGSHRAVVDEVDADPEAVEDGLRRLADADLIARESDRWQLVG